MRFTKDHEWVSLEGNVATIGITDHAQQALGDVVFVELPEPGRVVTRGEAVAVVESVKAASDVYAPMAGTVTENNAALSDEPARVNGEAEGGAWFYKLEVSEPSAYEALMDKAAYDEFVGSL